MRTLFLIIPVLIVFTSFRFLSPVSLTVEVKGFPTNEGKAYIAVFRDTDEFPVYGKQYVGMRASISSNKARAVFDALPSGDYAVAVFHDRNNNGKMDRNILGIPTEHYGFSRDARELFSAPRFSSASFSMTVDRKIIIQVK
jgi:uncharacterized protein (DUF2141 family)